MDIRSQLIHHPYRAAAGFRGAQPAVHKASTVYFESALQMRSHDWRTQAGYSYGLHGSPTTFTLQARLATLEGARHCLLTPSGLSSIALVDMALLASGDEVLIPANAYSPNLAFARTELARFGVHHAIYDPLHLPDLQAKLSARTKLVWIEPAGSITLEFPDVLRTAHICRQRGVIAAMDNTWGAGLAFNAFDLDGEGCGVDITVQALTKYPSGAANLLMGSVMTRDPRLFERLTLTRMHLGLGVGANDVESILQSLPTLALRYDAQDQSARALASWMAAQPSVACVLHPALKGARGHAFWRVLTVRKGQPKGRAAAIFSVIFKPQYEASVIDRFCESLALFKLGYSWAGPVSLVVPYALEELRQARSTSSLSSPSCSSLYSPWGNASLVRFCIGLEAVEDLQADLAQALSALQAA